MQRTISFGQQELDDGLWLDLYTVINFSGFLSQNKKEKLTNHKFDVSFGQPLVMTCFYQKAYVLVVKGCLL